MSDLYHVTCPRARKAHECVECRETIKPGERYYVHKQLGDGGFSTHKACLECHDLGDRLKDAMDREHGPFGPRDGYWTWGELHSTAKWWEVE